MRSIFVSGGGPQARNELERFVMCHRPSTNFNPSSTRAKTLPGSIFTRFVRIDRSTVITCEIFNTDGLERPESVLEIRTFPGALAREILDVMVATNTVEILLLLNELA